MEGIGSGEKLCQRTQLAQRQIRATTQVPEERHDARRREFWFCETARHRRSPLRHRLTAHAMDTGRRIGSKEIAVAVVLVLVAPRVLPVVEDLAAQNMPADPPRVRPALLAQ